MQPQTWTALLAAGREAMNVALHNAAHYRSEFLRGRFEVHDKLAEEEERKAAALAAEIRMLEGLLQGDDHG